MSISAFPFNNIGSAGGASDPISLSDSSPILALGNTSAFNNAQRTLDRSVFGSPDAGDLLIAFLCRAGYTGESLGTLFTPTFSPWSNVVGSILRNASDNSEFTCSIQIRDASGDSEDTCLMGGNGPFPSGLQITRWTGNLFVFPGTISPDNNDSEVVADVTGLTREGGMGGGAAQCLEVFCSSKRATAAQSILGSSGTGESIITLGSVDSIDNGFDNAMVGIWGYRFNPGLVGFAAGDWDGVGFTERSFAVAARYRSGLS